MQRRCPCQPCPICAKSIHNLDAHMNDDHDGWPCPKGCGKSFVTKQMSNECPWRRFFISKGYFWSRFSYCNWGHPILVVFCDFGDDETTKPGKKVDEHKLHAKAVVSMYFVFVWVVSFHPKNTKQNFGPIGVTVYSQGPFWGSY